MEVTNLVIDTVCATCHKTLNLLDVLKSPQKKTFLIEVYCNQVFFIEILLIDYY